MTPPPIQILKPCESRSAIRLTRAHRWARRTSPRTSKQPACTAAHTSFISNRLVLQANRTYFAIIELIDGNVLQANSSTIGVETWDEIIPVGLGLYDAFGMYHGLDIDRAAEDTPDKLEALLNALDKTDYIILSSNRAYATLPRQPLRYPMSTGILSVVDDGPTGLQTGQRNGLVSDDRPVHFPGSRNDAGDGPVARSHALPAVRPAVVHGQINVPMPPAEEAFSVYDHMRVLIFQKTADYSAAVDRAELGRIPLSRVLVNQSPIAATEAPNGLMLTDSVWQAQQQSGTWSDLFDVNSLLNQNPLLGAIVWYLLIAVLGLAAFPLLFAMLPGLRDRGYGVARIAGLLIVTFVVWFAASLHVITFSRGWIAVTVIALIAIGLVAAFRQRSALRDFWRDQRRTILIEEALFAIAFAWFLFVRFGNPDLWHPVMGGEKPMDFAYLNAVIKSNTFPPYDPWFAGGQITYYYFGFVLVATPIKLLGIVPAIAYNFAIPLLFALTALGAFSAAFNLVSQAAGRISDHWQAAQPDRDWTDRRGVRHVHGQSG